MSPCSIARLTRTNLSSNKETMRVPILFWVKIQVFRLKTIIFHKQKRGKWKLLSTVRAKSIYREEMDLESLLCYIVLLVPPRFAQLKNHLSGGLIELPSEMLLKTSLLRNIQRIVSLLRPSHFSVNQERSSIMLAKLSYILDSMTSDQKDAIASVLITLKFHNNENIVVEGDQASSFYIIKEGQVSVLKGGKELRKMNKGDSFGEQALYNNTVRGATVKAIGDNVRLTKDSKFFIML